MHRKFRKFRHGGTCNIVPGPRGLTGTEHPRLFPDLCGPDFLIQGVDHSERVPLVHLLSVYLQSGRPHHLRLSRTTHAGLEKAFFATTPWIKKSGSALQAPWHRRSPRGEHDWQEVPSIIATSRQHKWDRKYFLRGSPRRNRRFPVGSENFRSPEKRPEICLEDVSSGMRISGRHPIWRL